MVLRRVFIAVVGSALLLCVPITAARATEPTGQDSATTSPTPPAEKPAAGKYLLAFKFEPNQILRYEVLTEQEITTIARDESEIQKNYTKAKRHQRVASIDEKSGAADLELTIDWVYMRAGWDKQTPTEFQSDDPEKQPEKFKHILATVGKPLATIRFTTSGSPEKAGAPAGKAAVNKPVGNKPAGNEAPDGSREAHLIVLPEHPVAVGESWKERYDIVTFDESRNLTKITFQRVYKLVDVEGGKATIELKTMILSPGLSPSVLAKFLLAEVAGKITFDMERGVILKKDLTAQNTVVNAIPGVSSQMKGSLRYFEKLTDEEPAPGRSAANSDGNSKK